MAYTVEEIMVPSYNISNTKMTATRKLLVTGDLFQFFEAYVGTSFVAGSTVIRTASATFPGKPFLILEDVDVEAADPDNLSTPDSITGLVTSSSGYFVTLKYATQEFDQGDSEEPQAQELPPVPAETYLTLKVKKAAEMLTLPNSALMWLQADNDGSTEVGEDVQAGMLVPMTSYELTWHRVAIPPWSAITDLTGKVNGQSFLGHDPDAVLFMGLDGTRQFQTDGAREWELVYSFEVREIPFINEAGGEEKAGWNQYMRPNPGDGQAPWQYIVDNEFNSPYIQGNFGLLFNAGS